MRVSWTDLVDGMQALQGPAANVRQLTVLRHFGDGPSSQARRPFGRTSISVQQNASSEGVHCAPRDRKMIQYIY